MRPLFVMVLLLAGCRKEAPPRLEPVAVQRLREHLVNTKRPIFSERLGAERTWTDGAILERTDALPRALEPLLDEAPPDAGPKDGAMGALLQRLESSRGEWRPAKVKRSGQGEFDCAVSSSQATAEVNCLYVDYLEARHPEGRFRVKAPYEPVLFLEGELLRAALMPLKR